MSSHLVHCLDECASDNRLKHQQMCMTQERLNVIAPRIKCLLCPCQVMKRYKLFFHVTGAKHFTVRCNVAVLLHRVCFHGNTSLWCRCDVIWTHLQDAKKAKIKCESAGFWINILTFEDMERHVLDYLAWMDIVSTTTTKHIESMKLVQICILKSDV